MTTLEAALASQDDMILELSYPKRQSAFSKHLELRKEAIEDVVSFHLGLITSERECRMGAVSEWKCGYYNVCIPVYVAHWSLHSHLGSKKERVLIRIPLPYKCGGINNDANVEEKLRCEAATFIWITENCPDVPIPCLWGFGLPYETLSHNLNGERANESSYVPAETDVTTLTGSYKFIPSSHHWALNTGYLIMEYVEASDGELLSLTWPKLSHEEERRKIFFKDLARVTLSLAQKSFSTVGSITINNNGALALTNRPLAFRLPQLESRGVPTDIASTQTYSSTDPYFSDLLSCHASRIVYQRNSIRSQSDVETQFLIQNALRMLLPQFANRKHRNGPFFFTLTDIHPNNVFVDENWHIKCIIDLEWTCIRPVEYVFPPIWLTGRKVDQLTGTHLDEYKVLLEHFLETFETEEKKFPPLLGKSDFLTQAMRKSFDSGALWYFQALENPKTFCTLFKQHIWPMYSIGPAEGADFDNFTKSFASFWSSDAQEVIAKKLRDKTKYDESLRALFAERAVDH